MPSLTPENVRDLYPRETFTDAQLTVAIAIVTGWLLGATKLTGLPDPLPPEMWSAAVELTGLLAINPSSLTQRTAGPTTEGWSQAPRRNEILRDLRKLYTAAPRGNFPPAPGFPDGASVWPATVGGYERWVVR